MVGALRRLLIINDQREFVYLMSAVAERLRFTTRILPHALDLEYMVQHWRPDVVAVHMAMAHDQDVVALEFLEQIRFPGGLLLTGNVSQGALEKAAAVARTRGLAVATVLSTPCTAEQIAPSLRVLLDLKRAA